ncbi:MAG: hypothetical protein OEV53_10170 [Nitrospira sp.]|nr:hypothetical protein [Nitrospira sp.]
MMGYQATTTELILDALAVAEESDCPFEELMSACSGLTCNQIVVELDRLSREGHIGLSHDKPGIYRVRLSKPSSAVSTVMGRRGFVESDGRVLHG